MTLRRERLGMLTLEPLAARIGTDVPTTTDTGERREPAVSTSLDE